MIHPVTIKSPEGKVLRTISSESLEERSQEICNQAVGHFSSHKIREAFCERKVCRKQFWTRQRSQKFCSRDCHKISYAANAKVNKAKRKARLEKEKENQ